MKTNEGKTGRINPMRLLFTMMLTVLGGFASAQTNLIANPGFETSGAASWTETVTGTSPADGTGAGEYHTGAIGRTYWMPGAATIALKQTFNSPTAGTYSASIWSRRENYSTAGGGDYYRLRVMNGATQLAVANFPYGNAYAQNTLTGISVPSAATLIFIVEVLAQNGNCYVTVDDASLTLTAGTVATPTFSPGAGTYSSTQSVSISCGTSGASIYYTTDGSTPTTGSSLYSSAISVSTSKTLKALATKSGMTNSAIASAAYTISAGGATNYYVSTTGSNGNSGLSGSPWRDVSYAASQVPGGVGHTINVGAGTFSENSPVILNPKVNLTGAGQSSTIITKSGSFDVSNTDFNVPTGTLIQLVSSPLPSAPTDGGGQILSNFKVDGSSRTVKAGVWVQNRNNVTMTNVTITNTNFRGAAFSPGYKDWYIEPAYYLTGININNCTFTNTSKDVPANSQTLGALCISGLDGANIYNITINEDQGYGIKFIYDGYFKNTQIHDCTITVPETDSQWGEDASIEFWNAGTNNSIYNITCNTWLSLVNHASGPFGSATSVGQRLKVYGIKMIDGNASSGKESIEAAIPGLEIYDSYFQNKGFGVAIWDDGGKYVTVRNCTFYNSAAQSSWASGAVYIDNSTGVQFNNINIYNNIFDAINNAVNIKNSSTGGVSGVNIKNNAFLTGTGSDVVTSGSVSNVVLTNNINGKGYWTLTGVTTNSNNVAGDPQYQWTGNRYDNLFYAPASASSYAVAKGVNVGLPYSGTAPDIGRYEWTGGGGRQITSNTEAQTTESMISEYPNPTTGVVRITSTADNKIESVQVINPQGKTVLAKSVNQLSSTDIDLSQHANDIYILRVKHQRGVVTKKVVLMK